MKGRTISKAKSEAGKIVGKGLFNQKRGLFDPANKEKVKDGQRRGGATTGKRMFKEKRGIFAPEHRGAGIRTSIREKTGMFAPGMREKAIKHRALVLFTVGRIVQECTLGVLLGNKERRSAGLNKNRFSDSLHSFKGIKRCKISTVKNLQPSFFCLRKMAKILSV